MKLKFFLFILCFVVSSIRCTDANIDVEIPETPQLETWLDANPNVKAAIALENSNLPSPSFIGGGVLSETTYENWSDEDKQALQSAFARAWEWRYSQNPFQVLGTDEFTMPLNCDYCETSLVSTPTSQAITLIPEDLSKTVYFAAVAHSLMVELSGAVSWSILSDDASTLHKYFNSRALMHRNNSTTDFLFGSPNGTVDQRVKYIGNAVPATPRFVHAWLVNENILQSSHQATIEALLQWARENMIHYYGTSTYTNSYDHWQYAGRPPVDRVVEGTELAADPGIKNWTAGCHGTAGFIKSVLKVVNIPVETLYVCGHAQIYFPSIGMYLDHADNPYNNDVKNSSLTIDHLFIDQATHTSWFSATPDFLNPANPLCVNIGKKTEDFAAPAVGSLIISDGPTYDFGSVSVGFSATHTFTVTNLGAGSALSLSGTGLSAPYSFQGGAYPGTGGTCAISLAAAASCTIVVRYDPTVLGVQSDTIVIDYNDGSAAQSASRNITGTGVP
jgi:hypothetical protein